MEEFKFDNQNLRVFNSIGEDLSLLSLPAASHFTYSFNGTTGDADYIKFSGFGQRTVKSEIRLASMEASGHCSEGTCLRQTIIDFKSPNSSSMLSQSQVKTTINVPIVNINRTKKLRFRGGTAKSLSISVVNESFFHLRTDQNFSLRDSSRASIAASVGVNSGTPSIVLAKNGIRQNYVHDTFFAQSKLELSSTEVHQGTGLPFSTAGIFGHVLVGSRQTNGAVVLPNPMRSGHRMLLLNAIGCFDRGETQNDNGCTRERFFVDRPGGSYLNSAPRRKEISADIAILDCHTVGITNKTNINVPFDTISIWNCEMANEYGDQSIDLATSSEDLVPQTYLELTQ